MEKLLKNIKYCRGFVENPTDENIDFETLKNTLNEAEVRLRQTIDLQKDFSDIKNAFEEEIKSKIVVLGVEKDIKDLTVHELIELKNDIDKKFEENFKVIGIEEPEEEKSINVEDYKL